jgi:hypothetical protein
MLFYSHTPLRGSPTFAKIYSVTYTFSHATFHPVVGRLYQEAVFGRRLLILGESHYPAENLPTAASNVTDAVLTWHKDKRAFFKAIENILPKTTGARGCDCVAFYNFVQHFVGTSKHRRPAKKQWTSPETVDGFREVLDVLQPERILVVGRENWKCTPGERELGDRAPISEKEVRLSESFCDGLEYEVEKFARWYPIDPSSYALAAPIYDPRSGRLTTKDGKEVVDRLLSFPRAAPQASEDLPRD